MHTHKHTHALLRPPTSSILCLSVLLCVERGAKAEAAARGRTMQPPLNTHITAVAYANYYSLSNRPEAKRGEGRSRTPGNSSQNPDDYERQRKERVKERGEIGRKRTHVHTQALL